MVALGLAVTAVPGGVVAASAQPSGSSLTAVDVQLEWPNLDPELDNQAANDVDLLNAVYGELFTLRPSAGCQGACKDPGTVVPSMAKGYSVSPDGKTFTIELRKGMTFQDGTPFNSEAVKYNIERDLSKESPCLCKTNFSLVQSVTTDGPYAVQLHLSQRDVPLLYGFVDQAPNWIASPTAIKKMGIAKFGQMPVGAGPFQVVRNRASAELDLKKFSGYFQKGHPLLDSLKFISVGNDNSAVSALQAGTAQVVIGASTPQVIDQARQQFDVPTVPPVVVGTVEFNTKVAPFNNQKAREAIAYATDPGPIAQKLFGDLGGSAQDQVGPGNQFFQKNVPTYRHYNLNKAKALVKQLGGLKFDYITTNVPLQAELGVVLQQEWAQAGIKATVDSMPLTKEVADFESGNWSALAGSAGGPDPDVGVQSIPSRFASNGTFTCCHDPKLDALINQSIATTGHSARQAVFNKIYSYIDQKQYAVDVYTTKYAVIAKKGLKGITPTIAAAPASVALPWASVGLNG
ncbi:MAG: ABC transporter substrate-binding protein [Acidimicrobiaceae bacterium]|nr:ABC transporter substrate-binding protein [Acidimicrobiaceae bacterium]